MFRVWNLGEQSMCSGLLANNTMLIWQLSTTLRQAETYTSWPQIRLHNLCANAKCEMFGDGVLGLDGCFHTGGCRVWMYLRRLQFTTCFEDVAHKYRSFEFKTNGRRYQMSRGQIYVCKKHIFLHRTRQPPADLSLHWGSQRELALPATKHVPRSSHVWSSACHCEDSNNWIRLTGFIKGSPTSHDI